MKSFALRDLPETIEENETNVGEELEDHIDVR
jgi:hypothetical protein